jgi:hypothetical protein
VVFLTQKAMAHVSFKLLWFHHYNVPDVIFVMAHITFELCAAGTTSDNQLFYFFLMFTYGF